MIKAGRLARYLAAVNPEAEVLIPWPDGGPNPAHKGTLMWPVTGIVTSNDGMLRPGARQIVELHADED